MHRLAALTLVLTLVACDSDMDPPGMDAASADGGDVDAGSGDAAPGDGGDPMDAGPDAAPLDEAGVDGGPMSMPCTATGACDPFDATSCPSGQKCRVTDTGTECQDLTMTPPLGEGETCGVDTDCGPTFWCTAFGGGFTCRSMCAEGSVGDCGPDGACTGAIGAEACVRVCRSTPARCNIFTQDCADTTHMCTLTTHPETRENYTGCRPEGTLAVDEMCGGGLGNCTRGLICIRQDGVAACRQVCGVDGAAPTCAAGVCTGLARTWGVPYCR